MKKGTPPYVVVPYSFDALLDLLAGAASKDYIQSKTHSVYFEGYFAMLSAKVIVVENEYVDHDYLEDFIAFYVRCFREYPKTTRRLHFFSESFNGGEFVSLLKGDKPELGVLLQKSYLGFVVVKPLPQTIVGRTCLTTYPSDSGRRHFPILQRYSASLFGLDLKVDTLAFQEQDSVVAACATSALWSAFQGTGQIFHHRIPSPAEITRTASDYIPEERAQVLPETRRMPNHGLTPTQMAHAVRDIGLEPFLIGASDDQVLRCTLYAYLRAKIPLILVFALGDLFPNAVDPVVFGRHGVAVTGYSLGGQDPQVVTNTVVALRALRIDKIYVHDDQIGPFARMDVRSDGLLGTSWFARQNRLIVAKPQFLLAPLYHKIRIPYGSVQDAVLEIGQLLSTVLKSVNAKLVDEIEWDIYLTSVNEMKAEILAASTVSADERERVLTSHLPRFIWRGAALIGNEVKLDLLFDATDIEQSGAFLTAIEHDKSLSSILRVVVTSITIPGRAPPMVEGVYAFFRA